MPLLNAGRIELLDVPLLRAQLLGLERRTARGGRDSIDHAPRAHDDLVNAAAGAIVAAWESAGAGGSVVVTPCTASWHPVVGWRPAGSVRDAMP